jgi:hypothetical protein
MKTFIHHACGGTVISGKKFLPYFCTLCRKATFYVEFLEKDKEKVRRGPVVVMIFKPSALDN